jgi:hypothetical protein
VFFFDSVRKLSWFVGCHFRSFAISAAFGCFDATDHLKNRNKLARFKGRPKRERFLSYI